MGQRIHLLIATVGLLAALSADRAAAALLVDAAALAAPTADAVLQTLAEDVLDSMETSQAGAFPAPFPSDSPGEKDDPAVRFFTEGLVPGGAASPPSCSHSHGGPPGAALSGWAQYLPEFDLQGLLPTEAGPLLPTGPPLKLLRPV